MSCVLILYPTLFSCQTKFNRKVLFLLQRLDLFEITFLHDSQNLIKNCFFDNANVSVLKPVLKIDQALPDYAIVFDDGSEFNVERAFLSSNNIPYRTIKIAITRVINIKLHPELHQRNSQSYEYIGRGSYWGNPHSMHESNEERAEVIRKYQYDFEYNRFIKINPSRVHELAGKTLGCYCKPAPCHGDVLADFLNSYDDGQ